MMIMVFYQIKSSFNQPVVVEVLFVYFRAFSWYINTYFSRWFVLCFEGLFCFVVVFRLTT